jgi:hypothetical protein
MICDRARRLFGACWDDELTHAERDWLETHFASCSGCRTEYDQFSRALELAGSLPRAEASPDLVDRVLARARRVPTAPDVVGEASARWVPVVAATAAAVLVVAVLLVLPGSPWRASARVPAPQMTVLPGGPADAILVQAAVAKPAEPRAAGPRGDAAISSDGFDHSADVEFILDPVTLHRGRASVTRTGSRQPGAEGDQAIITF